ncbi:MAG: M48 family metalloprotease, partial [Pirellulaceae bacterium]
MIWLAGLIIALLVLASELPTAQPVEQVVSHLLLASSFMLLAPAFAVIQSRISVRRWSSRELLGSRSEFLTRSLLGTNLVVWLSGCVALLVIARWPQIVRVNWGLDVVPLLDELLVALPMIGSLIMAWLVIHDAELAIREAEASGEAPSKQSAGRWKLVAQRVRTFTGLVLVPVAGLFLARDLSHMFFPDGVSGLATGVSYIAFLSCLLCFYPLLVSLTWKTERFPNGELERSLLQISRQAGLPGERIRTWHTDSTLANAVVVGVMPRLRRIFFTDLLLDQFSDAEIKAVYRHEVGHLVHRHLQMRIGLVLVPLLILATALWQVGQAQSELAWQAFGKPMWLTTLWFIIPTLLMVYAARVVAPFVRKSEIEADLFAIAGDSGLPCPRRAEDYGRALIKMAALAPQL